jgi:hypothetical protein
MSQQNLSSYLGNSVMAFGSNSQLGVIIPAIQLGAINSKQNLGNMVGNVMVYDKANLQFLVGNKPELQNVLSSSQITALLQGAPALGNLAGVAVFSSHTLNLYQANIDLKSLFNSHQGDLGMIASSPQLANILNSQQGLNVVYSSEFINMVGQLGSMGLYVTPPVGY